MWGVKINQTSYLNKMLEKYALIWCLNCCELCNVEHHFHVSEI